MPTVDERITKLADRLDKEAARRAAESALALDQLKDAAADEAQRQMRREVLWAAKVKALKQHNPAAVREIDGKLREIGELPDTNPLAPRVR